MLQDRNESRRRTRAHSRSPAVVDLRAVGGLVTVALLARLGAGSSSCRWAKPPNACTIPALAAACGLAVAFLPGASPACIVGWFIIRPVNAVPGRDLPRLQRGFDTITERLRRIVGRLLRLSVLVLVVYGGLLFADLLDDVARAHRLHPRAGQGLPAGQRAAARLRVRVERTEEVMEQVEQDRRCETPGVDHTVGVAGQSFLLQRQRLRTSARCSSCSTPFDKRTAHEPVRRRHRRQAPQALLRPEIDDAVITVFGARRSRAWAPPAASNCIVEAARLRRSDGAAASHRRPWSAKATPTPLLDRPVHQFRANTPQLYVDIDRTKCRTLGRRHERRVQHALPGLPGRLLRQRFQPLRPHLAGERPGRGAVPRSARATSASSRCATSAARWCRWARLCDVKYVGGPVMFMRYNMYPAAAINGNIAPRHQLRPGDRDHGETCATELPRMAYEWTD